VVLFLQQNRGTEKIGRVFGPIMVAEVYLAGGAGRDRDRQTAANTFGRQSGLCRRLFVHRTLDRLCGAWVRWVLSVTGCEALYADMGHFGAKAIRWAWLLLRLSGAGAELFRPGAHCCCPILPLRHSCSMRWCQTGCIIPWWRWPPSPPSSHHRR
jgi:KUP system potassium uptake protein